MPVNAQDRQVAKGRFQVTSTKIANYTQNERNIFIHLLQGVVTMELLEERLGSNSTAVFNVKKLDLSNCKLTSLGNLLNDDYFPGLVELCLDNNNLSDVRGELKVSFLLTE